jgi:hypothetical protein
MQTEKVSRSIFHRTALQFKTLNFPSLWIFFILVLKLFRPRADSATGGPEEEWVARSVSERVQPSTEGGFAQSAVDKNSSPCAAKSLGSTGSTTVGDTASTSIGPSASFTADNPLTMPHTALVYQSLEGVAAAIPGPRGILSVKALRKTGYRAQEFSESTPILYNDLQIPITNVKKL